LETIEDEKKMGYNEVQEDVKDNSVKSEQLKGE
jgi:hypothetical protein